MQYALIIPGIGIGVGHTICLGGLGFLKVDPVGVHLAMSPYKELGVKFSSSL